MQNIPFALIRSGRTRWSLSLFVLVSFLLVAGSISSAQSITSISPTSGPVSGGNIVRVFASGFNFSSGSTIVWIGSSQATILKIVGNSEVDVKAPPSPFTGKIDVSVFNSAHVARLPNGYFYAGGGPASLTVGPISLADAVVNQPYNGVIPVTGGSSPYHFSISSGALPSGLWLSATGTISGTAGAAGSSSFTVRVTDSNGASASASGTLNVSGGGGPGTLTIGPLNLPSPVLNQAYNGTISVSGGVGPYHFSISSGALPSGLWLSATGTISGTASAAGSSSFTVRVTDSNGASATASATLTVAPPNTSGTLYVDANSGSDSNSGTASAPLRTIGAAASIAAANNVRGRGTKILINPGVYREFVNISTSFNLTSAPITFEAVTTGTAIIDGADVVTGWQGRGGNEYVTYWQDTVGCSPPYGWPTLLPIVQHNEMVFVNGVAMTQILDPADHRAGTFLVDSTYQQLHVWPPTGTNMNNALVEVAARPETFEVHGATNMTFRGLVFRHAATCIDTGSANVYSSTNILFDQVQAVWNNWAGLTVNTSTNITVQNSVASYNGGAGLVSFEAANALFQNNETDYNNWRGAMGAMYNFSMGGTKLMRMHGGKVLNHYAYRNHSQGLWFDTDGKNILIDHATLSENRDSNLQVEANEGPVTLQNSSLCSGLTGLYLINTADFTMTGNNFYNNGGTGKWEAEFFLGGNPGGRFISDWQTGQPYQIFTSNTVVSNNVFADAAPGQMLFNTFIHDIDWAQFANSLRSDSNTWNDPQTDTVFRTPLPAPPGAEVLTLSGWKNFTGQDLNSSWGYSSLATRNCGVPATSYPDFNVYADKQSYSMSGGVATINLQVRSFDFGAASLSTSALPPGVSASFSAWTLGNGDSVLTLRASGGAGYQSVPVTIFATSGSRVHSVTVSVTISPY